MLRYIVRPVSDRTQFTGKHAASPFQAGWVSTLDVLEREVQMLNGRDVVIEIDVTDRDIRNDGLLRADARPAGPGVRVCFASRHGPLAYGTDRFSHWQANVRAIALGLEALRRVDRYGISSRGEQYAGYKQIGTAETSVSRGQALRTLTEASGLPTGSPIHEVMRAARTATHPDRHDGDRSAWDRVQHAAQILGAR